MEGQSALPPPWQLWYFEFAGHSSQLSSVPESMFASGRHLDLAVGLPTLVPHFACFLGVRKEFLISEHVSGHIRSDYAAVNSRRSAVIVLVSVVQGQAAVCLNRNSHVRQDAPGEGVQGVGAVSESGDSWDQMRSRLFAVEIGSQLFGSQR